MNDLLKFFIHVFDAVPAGQKIPTVVNPPGEEAFRPNPRLLDLAQAVLPECRTIDFGFLDVRASAEERWYRVWPGEHYRLLAALTRILRPSVAVEIGTSTGMAALTIAHHMPPGGVVHTYDIAGWPSFANSWLTPADFAGGGLVQHLDDLGEPEAYERHRPVLEAAALIFVDGPKDNVMEWKLIERMRHTRFAQAPIMIFDDIHFPTMLLPWRSIDRPRLDLTSFGHWSGTGLVDWNG